MVGERTLKDIENGEKGTGLRSAVRAFFKKEIAEICDKNNRTQVRFNKKYKHRRFLLEKAKKPTCNVTFTVFELSKQGTMYPIAHWSE